MKRSPKSDTPIPKPRGTVDRDHRAGFSLVELVTTIALTAILSVGLANLMQHPLNASAAISRRVELVALSDLAMSRMIRDLRGALPNSIRVSATGEVIELLHTVGGGRYRLDPGVNDPGGPDEEDHQADSDWLSFGGDDRWNVLGRFQNLSFSYGTPLPGDARIAIYPTSASVWSEAASGADPGSITPSATSVTIADDGDEDQIQLSAPHRFTLESPTLRAYVVDTPITYLCDTSDGTLWRVDNYVVGTNQPTNRSVAPLAGGNLAQAAERVESCRFVYDPGSPTRSGLVTIEMVLSSAGERVRLLRQVHVGNAP